MKLRIFALDVLYDLVNVSMQNYGPITKKIEFDYNALTLYGLRNRM